jgi:hypothetical protein
MRAAALAPVSTVVDRPRIGIVQRIKPAVAMPFDKEPHLLNRLPDFRRLRAAAPFDPLLKSPSCRFASLARLPRDKLQRRRRNWLPFGVCRSRGRGARSRAFDLAISTARS